MGVDKDDVVTAVATVTAATGGAFVAGPLGAAVAGTAAYAATSRALGPDKSEPDEN